MRENFKELPMGVRDYLPGEAALRRYLENIFVELVAREGFQEVVTPSFEYYETLRESQSETDLIKFVDRTGELLALRGDMTTPIARVVSTKMKHRELPLKIFYAATVFSGNFSGRNKLREFKQLGIEVFGDITSKLESDLIKLMAVYLRKAKVKNLEISLGHVDILTGLIEEYELFNHFSEIKDALNQKDYVALEGIFERAGKSQTVRESLVDFLQQRGGKAILKKAKKMLSHPKAKKALEELEEVTEYLISAGVRELKLDFSLVRDLNYYTGLVFEAYTPYLGYPLGGGGRYDTLLKKFGWDTPAFGFALGLERIVESIANSIDK
ncbi:ATP phosphoribosyltransferase regulatory subunit [Carboxydothermus islandicus]|uniref:ATP phosphoribosyltransferase regulatory subunit n=1 Tax=Carboxydothermus islandicus TaxID=661089 RepID=A0A1L8D578_9THEO|nr:ATP phosphoribosyltransferase regulatory subunit [Carboxydothermus islandicus]GAV26247.1 ATP phosphoribosyltransferase regulatory subunit [Carboxydothermus islandicus]